MKIINKFINKKIYSGYRKLKKNNELFVFFKIKDELSDVKITNSNINLYFLEKYNVNSEILVRQFFIRKLLGYTFNKILLFCIGSNSKFIYPLHYKWIQSLKKNNIKTNLIMSLFLWYLFIFYLFLKDILFFIKYLTRNFFIKKKNIEKEASIYFIKLNKKNLPISSNDLESKNIINWFIEKYKFSFKYDKIFHDYKIEDFFYKNKEIKYFDSIIKSKFDIKNLIILFLYSVRYIFYSIFNLFKNNWLYLVFFKEYFLLKEFELTNKDNKSNAYLFHSSDWIFRPFWTYAAESEKIEIILYFYSANYEKNLKITRSAWHISSWPKLIVWDHYQKKFFENIMNTKTKIEIVNPIWFEDNSTKLNDFEIPKNSIAIFTELPQLYSRYVTIGFPDNHYSSENTIKMLEDIIEISRDLEIYLIHKPKRKIGKLINRRYLNFIKSLKKLNKNIVISSEINAAHIIPKCICTISQPFTSTALLSRYFRIPSIYYDNTGTLEKNHIAAHDIEIINDKKDLKKWIKSKII